MLERQRPTLRYALSILFASLALAVRYALDPSLQDGLPYASVFAAIAASAWFLGAGPSLVAAALGYVGGDLLFAVPRGELSPLLGEGLVRFVLFWTSALVIIGMGQMAQQARRRAEASERDARDRALALTDTERRLAERAEELEAILDLMPAGIYQAVDPSCTVITGNRAAHELFGTPGHTNLSKQAPADRPAPAYRVFHDGRELGADELPIQRAARGERVKDQEYRIEFPDGSVKDVFGSAGPLYDRNGRVRGSIAALMDVSARRDIEAALEREARTLAALLDDVPEGIMMIGPAPEFRIVAMSRHGREMIGVSEEDIVGRGIGAHIEPFGLRRLDGSRPAPQELPSWRALHDGETIEREEWLMRRADGATLHAMVRCAPIRDADGHVVGAIKCWVDITRQQEAEEARRRTEALYRAIGESIDYGVWVCDAGGGFLYASRSFLDLVGLTLEECSEFGWFRVLHPDEREQTLAAWEECVRTGAAWDRELRVRGVDGQWHPILSRGLPVRDDYGRVVSWAGINLDIGRLKAVEGSLRAADRLKDQFLATLAHELRNPLAPILNAVQLLQLRGSSEPGLIWARRVIDRQVTQMARLLDDLLDLSRLELDKLRLQRERVTIGGIVEAALETCRPAIDAGRHELRLDMGASQAVVLGDPVRLAQVFSNLINNAAKYTDPGGHILISTACEGSTVVVRVRDDGIGFQPEQASHLFELFSQADEAQARSAGGLGIGLALVRGLVDMHGGDVTAHSSGPGRGSEFTVRLPLAPAGESSAPAKREPAAPLQFAGRRVLIADDNVDAAESLAMLLRARGHEVRTAHDGDLAFAVAEAFQPDAAVIDLGMPGLSGTDVAMRIRSEPWGEGMLLVALTGWGHADDRRRTAEAGFDHHLVKPTDPAELDQLLLTSATGG